MSTWEHLLDRIQGKAEKGQRRSGRWPGARELYLMEHPDCAGCGATRKVQVHHVIPFKHKLRIELEAPLLLRHGREYRGEEDTNQLVS